jgi:hypothetical protein
VPDASSPSRKTRSTPAPSSQGRKSQQDDLLEHARVMGVQIITNQAEQNKDDQNKDEQMDDHHSVLIVQNIYLVC